MDNSLRNAPDHPDDEEKSVASASQSLVGDLPIFPKEAADNKASSLPKNKSAPSLSKLQRQKVESGLYLHPTQIPRSLSQSFIHYQADAALTPLYDLPMYAGIGIGGAATLDKLQKSLSDLEGHLRKLPTFDRMEQQESIQKITSDPSSDKRHVDPITGGEAGIPAVPMAIPPTSTSPPITDEPVGNLNDVQLGMVSVDIGQTSTTELRDELMHIKRSTHDMDAYRQRVATEVEALKDVMSQGYTCNLILAILQALIGAFLYGWSLVLILYWKVTVRDI